MNVSNFDKGSVFEIRVIGNLDETWAEWFDGFTITHEHGTTLIVGTVVDQAALFGLLNKLNSLGLKISSLRQVGGGNCDAGRPA